MSGTQRNPAAKPADGLPADELVALLTAALTATQPGTGSIETAQGMGQLYEVGVAVAARELAAGVLREVSSGAQMNAMRLARHLYEYYVQLKFVLADRASRLPALVASDAKARHQINRFSPDLRPLTVEQQLAADQHKFIVEKANSEAKVSGKQAFLPKFEQMAQETNIGDSYNLYYRTASALSHPGILGSSEAYLVYDESTDSFQLRDGGIVAPALSQPPLALATLCFIGIFSEIGDIPPLWVGLQPILQALTSRIASAVESEEETT